MSSVGNSARVEVANAVSGAAVRIGTFVRRQPGLLIAGLVLFIFTGAAFIAPWISPFDPEALAPMSRLLAPGQDHLLGTDRYGRDLWSRILFGGRISLLVAWSVTALALVLGSIIGLTAGFFRKLDNPLMRVMDGFMAFPAILLAIALMAALGPNVTNVIIALTAVYTPRMARVVRSATLVVKEHVFVEAAEATGASKFRILLRHVMPATLPAAMVQATLTFAFAVLAEASLSFLGVGSPPTVPSWGNIISEGRIYIRQAPWVLIYPGVVISVTVLAVNVVGDGLRDLLDPHLRSKLDK